MEPANLTPDDQRLAELLRQPTLADDGFSARVVAALPAPRPRESSRPIFIIVGTLAGLVVAVARIGSWSDLLEGVHRTNATLGSATAVFDSPSFWLGMAVAAASTAYALLAPGQNGETA